MAIMARHGYMIAVHYCEHGVAYHTPTYIYSNHKRIPFLLGRYQGAHFHERPSGTVQVRGGHQWRTSLASAYRPQLARA